MNQAETPLDLDEADTGEPDKNSQTEIDRVQAILKKHKSVFLGKGTRYLHQPGA